MLFLHKIINGVWMIEQSFAVNYLPYVTHFLNNPTRVNQNRKPEQFLHIYESSSAFLSPFGESTERIARGDRSGYDSRQMIRAINEAPEGSVAVINISGAITKHDQECGPDGMQSKASVLRTCFDTQNIKGVIFRIDSGGGEGSAMRLMAEAISQRNKPVIAFVDDFACSAAYGIASACDHIIVNSEMAQVGSIGTYLTIADYEKYYEKQGIKLTEIYATLSSDKNKDYYEALKGNLEPLRKVADKFNENFLAMIEKNREGKLTSERQVWGTGKVWFAQEALKLGLIDEINTFTNALNSIV